MVAALGPVLTGALQASAAEAGGTSPLRFAVRVVLGLLIAVLLTYIVLEQAAAWRRSAALRRRRSGRDTER